MYYQARFYDPQVGRFLSEDPLGLGAGPNLFEYAYNNPLRYSDPTGNNPWQWAVAGGGALTAAAGGGAVGAAAAAAAPPLLVAAAGAAAIYGAWHFGEWIADQPWNPLTHPKVPPAPPLCSLRDRVIPFPQPVPRPTPLFPPLPNKPGELCPLKEQQGRICIYECRDGMRFTTLLADKNQKCPPVAGR